MEHFVCAKNLFVLMRYGIANVSITPPQILTKYSSYQLYTLSSEEKSFHSIIKPIKSFILFHDSMHIRTNVRVWQK